jgi:hypothetical protein
MVELAFPGVVTVKEPLRRRITLLSGDDGGFCVFSGEVFVRSVRTSFVAKGERFLSSPVRYRRVAGGFEVVQWMGLCFGLAAHRRCVQVHGHGKHGACPWPMLLHGFFLLRLEPKPSCDGVSFGLGVLAVLLLLRCGLGDDGTGRGAVLLASTEDSKDLFVTSSLFRVFCVRRLGQLSSLYLSCSCLRLYWLLDVSY